MKRSTRAFVLALGLFPLAATFTGCKDGQMDPGLSSMMGKIGMGGDSGGSKEAAFVSGGAQLAQGAAMNEVEAAEIGESVALNVVSQYGVVEDEALQSYVNNVGLTVASCSSRADINYTFGVLATDEVNALSMPGGFVFITRGALMKMQDESELAGVLAHEVGHLCLSHGRNALRGAKMASGVGKMATAGNNELAAVVDEAQTELGKPFGKGDENKADAEAVKILRASGYDPSGLARYLERVQVGSGQSGGLFSTHPATPDRIAKIKTAIGSTAGGATLKDRFAHMTKK